MDMRIQDQTIGRYRRLIIAVALNVPILAGILLYNMKNMDFSPLTWVYFSTVSLGYYTLIILVMVTLAFLFLFYMRKLATASAVAIITAAVFFLIVDGFAYHITKIHIDPFWMEWIINDLSAFGISAVTLRAVFICLFGLIIIELIVFALAGKIARMRGVAVAFIILSVLAFATSQVIHLIAYEKNAAQITALTPRLPLYYPITSHKNAQKYGSLLPVGEDVPAYINDGPKGSLQYPLTDLKFSLDSGRTDPNILIILFESWRDDAMTPAVTPNACDFSEKSIVFLDHFCSGNSTVAGLFGLFYGLHATYWETVKANNARIDNPVIIDILEDRGYSFGIFARSNFKRHKLKDAIFRGIEVHESFAGDDVVEQDRNMTDRLISFLDRQKETSGPFLALAFYKSNHAPYWYPPRDSLFFPAGDQNLVLADDNTDPGYYFNDYLNSTHYVDRLVGRVLGEVERLGLLSNTIVIVTTDHAEEFNDNRANYWGHGSNFTQYQTRVPLIMYVPDREPHQVSYRTSHIDIIPTIMKEYLGCTNEVGDYSNGMNLLEQPNESRPLVIGSYVNHAFVFDQDVYEIYPIQIKSYRLDNIKSQASKPPLNMVKKVFEEIGRFYRVDSGSQATASR